jgi:hypothetical protein
MIDNVFWNYPGFQWGDFIGPQCSEVAHGPKGAKDLTPTLGWAWTHQKLGSSSLSCSRLPKSNPDASRPILSHGRAGFEHRAASSDRHCRKEKVDDQPVINGIIQMLKAPTRSIQARQK